MQQLSYVISKLCTVKLFTIFLMVVPSWQKVHQTQVF